MRAEQLADEIPAPAQASGCCAIAPYHSITVLP
jgi:hypothetical protein